MKYRISILTILVGVCGCLKAQSLSPTVLSSNGGTGTAGELSLAWTLGELATESVFTKQSIHTEGFHQPAPRIKVIGNETIAVRPREIDGANVVPEISVYPNPVNAQLTIDINGAVDSEIQLQVLDMYGRLSMDKKIHASTHSLQVDMQRYADGLYLLHFKNMSGDVIATYKVVKTQ